MCLDEFLPNSRIFLIWILEVIFVQDAQEKGYSQSAELLAHEDAAKGGSIFKLHSDYEPTGDQPQAIEALVKGFQEGNQCQTLLGVTGSEIGRASCRERV